MFFQDVTVFLAAQNGQIHWSKHFLNSDIYLWEGLTIPQAWSLGVELSFYLVAPFFLNLRSRWLVLVAFCTLTAKMAALSALHLGDPWTYRFFPFELGYFLLGALAFRYRGWVDHLTPRSIEKYCVYLLAVGFAAFRVPVNLSTLEYPLALACVLPFMFRVTSELKVDRLLGELSYPFYIFHLLAFEVATKVTLEWLHWSNNSVAWVGLGLTLAASVIALALELRFIEPWRVPKAAPQPRAESQEESPQAAVTVK